MKLLKKRRGGNKKNGYTLLELLVVISIIGILSSVVLSNLNEARSKARDIERIEQLGEIKKALALYRADNGKYPEVVAVSKFGAEEPIYDWSNLEVELAPYLPRLSVDPINSGVYTYVYWSKAQNFVWFFIGEPRGEEYDLWANLENPRASSCPSEDRRMRNLEMYGAGACDNAIVDIFNTAGQNIYLLTN